MGFQAFHFKWNDLLRSWLLPLGYFHRALVILFSAGGETTGQVERSNLQVIMTETTTEMIFNAESVVPALFFTFLIIIFVSNNWLCAVITEDCFNNPHQDEFSDLKQVLLFLCLFHALASLVTLLIPWAVFCIYFFFNFPSSVAHNLIFVML